MNETVSQFANVSLVLLNAKGHPEVFHQQQRGYPGQSRYIMPPRKAFKPTATIEDNLTFKPIAAKAQANRKVTAGRYICC